MEKEMEKKLLMIKRKQQDAEAWAKVDSMGPLSEERRVEEFLKALQAIAEKEEREIESKKTKDYLLDYKEQQCCEEESHQRSRAERIR